MCMLFGAADVLDGKREGIAGVVKAEAFGAELLADFADAWNLQRPGVAGDGGAGTDELVLSHDVEEDDFAELRWEGEEVACHDAVCSELRAGESC